MQRNLFWRQKTKEDAAAVRKFDRNRPGKGSNQDWENPHDPDAKIGPKKDGATDMIYKPETVVDLDSGAIVQAEVQPGDQADHQGLATKVLEAQQAINQARSEAEDTLTVEPRLSIIRPRAEEFLLSPEQGVLQQEHRGISRSI